MSVVLWVAVVILVITSVGLLIARDWRVSIILLATQYLALSILLLPRWPLGLVSVKLVAGWMSSAILGMTRSGIAGEDTEDGIWSLGRLFRLFAAGMVIVIVVASAQAVDKIMAGAGISATTGSLLLIGMGLLHLGITSHMLRVTLGLMTVLAGFELLYSSVESSTLVVGLLAIINLGMALAGSYLLLASTPVVENTEQPLGEQ